MTFFKAPRDTALIGVDLLNDFCKNGSLEVNDGDATVYAFNRLRQSFETIVLQQDWHPKGHKSFASSHADKQPFDTIETSYGAQVLWPDHCVQNTTGANFHTELVKVETDLVIRKGTNAEIDSYSAFFENDQKTQPKFSDGQTFTEKMNAMGIKRLVFTGLAYDYCVGWNALDAVKEGFEAIVVKDATRSIAPESEAEMTTRLLEAGVKVINAADLPRVLGSNPPAPDCS